MPTMRPRKSSPRLIETDAFPFEFVSRLAERESWRKEIHRPIYHVHKWWAKRLGSVFRGILLGTMLPEEADFPKAFYKKHLSASVTVFDPFMGSGTTIGEAHKLGFTAIGRDINPVAVEAVRTALGPMDQDTLQAAFKRLSERAGEKLRTLTDRKTHTASRAMCSTFSGLCGCRALIAANQSTCCLPGSSHEMPTPIESPRSRFCAHRAGRSFLASMVTSLRSCRGCGTEFNPQRGPADGAKATCLHCNHKFTILDAIATGRRRPEFRLYGKLVLTHDGEKQYLAATADDQAAYRDCSAQLRQGVANGSVRLPTLALEHGFNTRQAVSYGFTCWRDFFNDRQLLALGWLHAAIDQIPDAVARAALLTLFSGALEFNNMFASYKGEGTGAVRHMFSHHILKPERAPIEANFWGTPKSSGAFSNLFRSRLLRAIEYREAPTEVNGTASARGRVCAPRFTGNIEEHWPVDGQFGQRDLPVLRRFRQHWAAGRQRRSHRNRPSLL